VCVCVAVVTVAPATGIDEGQILSLNEIAEKPRCHACVSNNVARKIKNKIFSLKKTPPKSQ